MTTNASGAKRAVSIDDLDTRDLLWSAPVRTFTWRTTQRHRPGLQYMTCLDRQVGFESLQEQRLLLALDFDGRPRQVLGQPFTLNFTMGGRFATHVPDFFVRGCGAPTVINVRPEERVADTDRVKFAACDALAGHLGWRHEVVVGWRQPAMSVVGDLSARRRPLRDTLGVEADILREVRDNGPVAFASLVRATVYPAVARAHVLALLWRRALDVDLNYPLSDRTLVGSAASRTWSS